MRAQAPILSLSEGQRVRGVSALHSHNGKWWVGQASRVPGSRTRPQTCDDLERRARGPGGNKCFRTKALGRAPEA